MMEVNSNIVVRIKCGHAWNRCQVQNKHTVRVNYCFSSVCECEHNHICDHTSEHKKGMNGCTSSYLGGRVVGVKKNLGRKRL